MVGVSSVRPEQTVQSGVEVAAQVTVICGRRSRPGPDDHPITRRELVEPVGHEMPEATGHEMAGHRASYAAPYSEADPRWQGCIGLSGIGTGPRQRHDQCAPRRPPPTADGG